MQFVDKHRNKVRTVYSERDLTFRRNLLIPIFVTEYGDTVSSNVLKISKIIHSIMYQKGSNIYTRHRGNLSVAWYTHMKRLFLTFLTDPKIKTAGSSKSW